MSTAVVGILRFGGAGKHPQILVKTQYYIIAIFAKNIAISQYCNISCTEPANATLMLRYF
jgi:hypothetical protein